MSPETTSGFTISDILLSCIYGGIIIFVCYLIRLKNAHLPHYKYFLPGIIAKIIGAVFFCSVYVYVYKEGDAISYFRESKVIAGLLSKDPISFARIIFLGDISFEDVSRYTSNYHAYLCLEDKFIFSFLRFVTPFTVISFGNFMTATILLATFSFAGIWKLYGVFCQQFPALIKQMAIAIFFIPSVVFWGSGFLKDTLTLCAMCWFIYGIHTILYSEVKLKWITLVLISSLVLILIKPYIIYGLISASSVWMATIYLKKISKPIERYFLAPIIIIIFSVVALHLVYNIGKEQGRFSLKKTEMDFLDRQTHSDAKSSFYKRPIDNTFLSFTKGILSNINATLFRPYIWEVRNFIMASAAIENVFFLFFALSLFFKFRFIFLFRYLIKTPFLVFCLFFVLIMALIVGISTDNFGTLDRFRIPLLPFYLALCFIFGSYLKEADVGVTEKMKHI